MIDHTGPIFEVAPRDDLRAPAGRRSPPYGRVLVLLLPAALLVGGVVIGPLVATFVLSFAAGPGGLSNYAAVLADPGIGHAMANSLRWLVFAPLICVVGLALAWPIRHRYRPQWVVTGVLAAPLAVSALVAAVAFRLIFDEQPGRGIIATAHSGVGGAVPFLGPGWIWLVLSQAFAWQWLGLSVIVFRAGLAGVPGHLLRVARAFGASRARRAAAVVVPSLFPVGALMMIIVLVAAARVFELVLTLAPGSIQDQADVVGVHLWRFGPLLGAGKSAALAVLFFVFVSAVALAGLWGLTREWPTGLPTIPAPGAKPSEAGTTASSPRRWIWGALSVAMVLVWAMPLLTLLLTSLHAPAAAARGGWWSAGWGWDSYRQAFASGQLTSSLASTAVRAVGAAGLLLVVAVPAAYVLAWGRLPRPAARSLIAVSTVLAVLPPQVVAGPLGYTLDHMRLLGAATPLILVHAAFGVPLGVLLLRSAFTSVPREIVRARQLDPVPGSAMFAVLSWSWPTLIAVAVLEFVLVWNDLVVGLLFGGSAAGTVTLVLFEQTREFATAAGPLAAASLVITVIPLALVLATGKWLVRGLTGGGAR
jgi:alpha-glucoside transport system permease protein